MMDDILLFEDKKSNQEHFNAYDENKDGTLDFKELIELFDPEDGNSFEATADHLIYHADQERIFEIKEETLIVFFCVTKSDVL
jgi:Ca2+-binding EF-hand superfamily protein